MLSVVRFDQIGNMPALAVGVGMGFIRDLRFSLGVSSRDRRLRRFARSFTVHAPERPKAKVLFSVLPRSGLADNGKISSDQYLPTFCKTIAHSGFTVAWASNEKLLARELKCELPVFLIHLFSEGQDHISSPNLTVLEQRCAAVFNASKIGELLSDKLESHISFARSGIPVPNLRHSDGFARSRFGWGRETFIIDSSDQQTHPDADLIFCDFIDTRITYSGRQYYTSVRLLCLDDHVLHAYSRARDVSEGKADVHAEHTPIDHSLIEHLHAELVRPRTAQFDEIAKRLHRVLGHGFYEHDLLVESETGKVYVCESGFRFDDPAYWRKFEPIASGIPSQAPLFPVEQFARRSAEIFVARCEAIMARTEN